MHIVILDGYTENPGDLSWDAFAALGNLTVHDRTPPDLIAQRIGGAEAAITNKCPITKETLDACPNLRYVGVLATGYNVIDVGACAARGVVVTNIPDYGTAAVAQFAIALLLELCHRVGAHSDSVFSGEWQACPDWTYRKFPLVELAGTTMGIIGFGRIGQATARIAQAMGMRVLAAGRTGAAAPGVSASPGGAAAPGDVRRVDLDTLLAESDVISLHCPLTPETRGIINARTIAKMKHGVFIVNTARGPLIDEEDLRAALETGKVGGAAMDVVSAEPIAPDNPLLRAKNCIITPHIAWAPLETRRRLMGIAADNLRAFLAGTPKNRV